MTLHFIAKDPETNGDHCPTVWFDDERGEFVVQGWDADEALRARCLQAGPIPPGESVVRIPARMADVLREALDAADRTAVR
ncbi:hypothetical protein K388_01944 [Streptomyces sp. KhCrAH-43]|uniref:hypothetical protein n=1 Tax=unclassified Streptomyces TaxID=2593676 RepID=UPI000381F5DA|nr:hypothetical protein [Streptomyces sp. KhCrAH-43]MYS34944.1 hypothetical protein [Streptomyces sp. SID4920]MYX65279.1 hypothetical protein [Streptomyces sp. SID8373]RAJ64749.1 hypothetical protein K388_01944 [Streptomyces sp. KhCrAH-43]